MKKDKWQVVVWNPERRVYDTIGSYDYPEDAADHAIKVNLERGVHPGPHALVIPPRTIIPPIVSTNGQACCCEKCDQPM